MYGRVTFRARSTARRHHGPRPAGGPRPHSHSMVAGGFEVTS